MDQENLKNKKVRNVGPRGFCGHVERQHLVRWRRNETVACFRSRELCKFSHLINFFSQMTVAVNPCQYQTEIL